MLVLSPAYDHKWPLRPLVLKTDVTLVKTLRLISLDFCYREFILQWSDMQKSDMPAISPDLGRKLSFFCFFFVFFFIALPALRLSRENFRPFFFDNILKFTYKTPAYMYLS